MKDQKFLSVAETAKVLGVSQLTLRSWIKQGLVPSTRVRKKILIPIEFLQDLERRAGAVAR